MHTDPHGYCSACGYKGKERELSWYEEFILSEMPAPSKCQYDDDDSVDSIDNLRFSPPRIFDTDFSFVAEGRKLVEDNLLNIFGNMIKLAHYDISIAFTRYSNHGRFITKQYMVSYIREKGDSAFDSKARLTSYDYKYIPLRKRNDGKLQYGDYKCKPCNQAKFSEILNCIQSFPIQINRGVIRNNCQRDIKNAADACCLSGFTPLSL